MFTDKETAQISAHGLDISLVTKQLDNFKRGFPFLPICRAAILSDGIIPMIKDDAKNWARKFNELKRGYKIVKFVPASGAATRMFKEIFEFVDSANESTNANEVAGKIDCFAFASKLRAITKNSSDPNILLSAIIKDGLWYGSSPKALILFHAYDDGSRTALEEHLSEGALYAADSIGNVNIHFTVSPEHQQGFEAKMKEVLPKYEKKYGVKYLVSYSQQKSSTDTIAANLDNTPLKDSEGNLLFRPAGHGALIENLGDIDADLIYIKTIDNVAPDHLKEDTVIYKQALGAVLLELQRKCFDYLRQLDLDPTNESLLNEIATFISTELSYKLPERSEKLNPSIDSALLRAILDRPIRICGMVKNEGEPGGGPFWVGAEDRSESLQIVESSQISEQQKRIMSEATHFNPVDLVCAIKDYKGHKFDLSKFIDPKTGFISVKSKDGRELLAQELPGLWNGAMANWNTLFVEVPITTFSPVKIINDLLREQHQ